MLRTFLANLTMYSALVSSPGFCDLETQKPSQLFSQASEDHRITKIEEDHSDDLVQSFTHPHHAHGQDHCTGSLGKSSGAVSLVCAGRRRWSPM